MNTQQAELPRLSYTVRETAAATGISVKQLYRMISNGEVEAKRFGGVIVVPAAVFKRLIEDAPDAAAS